MYIGIDLGGTNIVCGLVDDNGMILQKASRQTRTERIEELIDDMSDLSRQVAAAGGFSMSDIKWTGVGSPGSVDSINGSVIFAGNLPFRNTPVVKMLADSLGTKVYLTNDANAAALGELYAGAVTDYSSVLLVTLGTGIGGGIIINRKIYGGFNGCAGEIGHMSIVMGGRKCTCGRKGCWEAYASATGLIASTSEAMRRNPGSIMHEIVRETGGKITGRTAFSAMRSGDIAAKRVVERYIRYLSCGLSNIINILQPEAVCIGGGLAGEGDTLINPLRECVYKDSFNCGKYTVICKAKLGNDAGVIGAAMLGHVL